MWLNWNEWIYFPLIKSLIFHLLSLKKLTAIFGNVLDLISRLQELGTNIGSSVVNILLSSNLANGKGKKPYPDLPINGTEKNNIKMLYYLDWDSTVLHFALHFDFSILARVALVRELLLSSTAFAAVLVLVVVKKRDECLKKYLPVCLDWRKWWTLCLCFPMEMMIFRELSM